MSQRELPTCVGGRQMTPFQQFMLSQCTEQSEKRNQEDLQAVCRLFWKEKPVVGFDKLFAEELKK